MSSGRLPTRSFAPEDDWFVETGGGRSPAADDETELREARQSAQAAVSYTHLTLPTN